MKKGKKYIPNRKTAFQGPNVVPKFRGYVQHLASTEHAFLVCRFCKEGKLFGIDLFCIDHLPNVSDTPSALLSVSFT